MEGIEIHDQVGEIAEGAAKGRLNRAVAVTVALVAVFMALCNIKDGNICQSMMQSQAEELDHWNQYQAKSTKQHLDSLAIEQSQLQASLTAGVPAAGLARLLAQIRTWKAEVARYETEKADLKHQAEDSHNTYDALNFRDDQFDFSEALLGLAITLFAVCSLVQSRALYGFGLLITCGGFVMGLAGFFQWHIHPGVISFLT